MIVNVDQDGGPGSLNTVGKTYGFAQGTECFAMSKLRLWSASLLAC